MKSKYRAAIIVAVGIAAGKIARCIHAAAQAVQTRVVIFAATAIMIITVIPFRIVIWAARCICQRAKIVIEGMIFLHDDDNVFGLVWIAFGLAVVPASKAAAKTKNGSAKRMPNRRIVLSPFMKPL